MMLIPDPYEKLKELAEDENVDLTEILQLLYELTGRDEENVEDQPT